MNSIFSRMGRVYRVLRRTFGVKVVPLFIAVLFGFVRTLVAIAMALDNVFLGGCVKTRATTGPSSWSVTRVPVPPSCSASWPTRGSAPGWSSS